MLSNQFILTFSAKLVVVLFAGAGGSCTGIEQAIRRHVDHAANHNENAISCHRANHPQTQHHIEDVRRLNPRELTGGQPVGYFHASPDCTHFSQAKGGQPRSAEIRSLPWVVHKWAGTVRPEVITLENVKEIQKWCRLIAKRDKATGRVIRLDGTVAGPGERVPRHQQFLIPDPKHTGKTWRRYIALLRGMGYAVEVRVLCAADFGVPTTRTRLFIIARCDGLPITWPAPTHFKNPAKGQKKWVSAHTCIDFTLPSRSIFDREKPLADATLRRVARGMKKFVLDSADPFIVPVTHSGAERVQSIREPLRTITTARRGEFMLASPVLAGVGGRAGQTEPRGADSPLYTITTKADTAVATACLIQAGHGEGRPGGVQRWGSGARDIRESMPTITASGGGQSIATACLIQAGYGERKGQAPRTLDLEQPLGTIVAGGGKHALVTAFVEQANGGFYDGAGRDARDPVSAITTTGSQQRLVTATLVTNTTGHAGRDLRDPAPTLTTGQQQALVSAHLATLRNNMTGADLNAPAPTVSAGGEHHALVEYRLSPEHEAGALRCAAFLLQYYSEGGQWSDLRDPVNSITTRDRLALVTVWIKGSPYVVVDICLRMLTPRELANASSFPPQYIITHGHDGRIFNKQQQVFFIGNAVPPLLQQAVTAANFTDFEPVKERMAA